MCKDWRGNLDHDLSYRGLCPDDQNGNYNDMQGPFLNQYLKYFTL